MKKMGRFNGTPRSSTERITCAAIWYKELPNAMYKPMTSNNRFVDRLEAAEIAIKAGQVYRDFLDNPMIGLFSEDLY